MSLIDIAQPCCMNADNINITFQKTFEFIKDHQVSKDGYLLYTTIFLKISLTDVQTPTTPRSSASNTVTGIVTGVNFSYVTILAKTACNDKFDEYTIEFSKIIEFYNSSISLNFDEYLNALYELPKICYDCKNQYIDTLINLNKTFKKLSTSSNKTMKILFDGVTSRIISPSTNLVRKNFVIIEEFFIFPITVISGYVIVPICDTSTEAINKDGDTDV